MTDGRSLDHVVLASRDLGGLAARWERLGFTLTPRAQHEDRMGTANRLAQFGEHSFVELLEVDRPDGMMAHGDGAFGFGAWNRQFLREREGVSMIVFRTDDARADIARWQGEGIETYEPFDFEREAGQPDGTTLKVAFSLGFATDPALPGLAIFVCQNRYPENFWKPAFQTHDNGATGFEALRVAAPDPEAAAAFFGRLFGGSVTPGDGAHRVACGAHRIEVTTPDATGVPGWQGPGVAAMRLRGAGRPVQPAEAGGVAIEWTN